MTATLDPITRITRDLKTASRVLTTEEARYLVDTYYAMQKFRTRTYNQIGAVERSEAPEPVETLAFFGDQFTMIENNLKSALGAYANSKIPGKWAQSICGIGDVLSAALLAHIDITKAPTAGHIWRFAGLDPTSKWNKGEKRPWNATLRVVAWKLGDSFMKQKNRESAIYGPVYDERKALEISRNEAGAFAEQAAAILAAKKFAKSTEAYKAYSVGKLPPAHIDARARRYAVKVFLSHYQHVAYYDHYGVHPPKPYVITHLGHAHFIEPPNWPF